jgi:hypothetical protein
MNVYETKWCQGNLVILLENPVDQKEIVRQTDYVLLQMMGRIAHKCALLPVVPKSLPSNGPDKRWPNYKDRPFKH